MKNKNSYKKKKFISKHFFNQNHLLNIYIQPHPLTLSSPYEQPNSNLEQEHSDLPGQLRWPEGPDLKEKLCSCCSASLKQPIMSDHIHIAHIQ